MYLRALLVLFLHLCSVECGILGTVTDFLYFNTISLRESCDSKWVPANITGLEHDLNDFIYGQPFVADYILPIVKSHWENNNPRKPLAISFHGRPGTGKNYVADFIAKNLFKEGTKSKFRTYFSLDTFPLKRKVDEYKSSLKETIRNKVQLCGRALFVFDEVDKIPEGLFDVVKNFLDYHEHIEGVDYRRSMFLFLSNTGATTITKECERLHKKGLKREEYNIKNFHYLLMDQAYDEEGGMKGSSLVKNHVIDVYLPFLPLEKDHVEKCINDFARNNGERPSKKLIESVLGELAFGPEPLNLFSTTGCKQVEAKVQAYIIRSKWEL